MRSYKLADGSMSTDYKVGDGFTYEDRPFTLVEDDKSNMPWFREIIQENDHHPIDWASLTPVRTANPPALIKSIRETMKYLERTIKELES